MFSSLRGIAIPKTKKRTRKRRKLSSGCGAVEAKRPCLRNDDKHKGLSTGDVEQAPPTGRESPLAATVQLPTATTGVVVETTDAQTAVPLSSPTVIAKEEDTMAAGLKRSADEEGIAGVGDDTVRRKRAQLVVGMNAVTRLLEQGALQVGLLCTSSPKLLCQHLVTLAATRKVPFATLPNLSEVVAKLLGIKRAMCIGLRVS